MTAWEIVGFMLGTFGTLLGYAIGYGEGNKDGQANGWRRGYGAAAKHYRNLVRGS
jgi:hypothetical protein